MKISGLICVKYDSTRLPFKNIRKFGNTTLLDLKIENLLKLDFLDEIIVNTESEYIINNYLTKYGDSIKIVKRDEKYSKDSTENYEFCKNVVENIDNEIVMYTPVTMPFITTETYTNMYNKFNENINDSIILVADGKMGNGHTIEKHSFCFGCSIMKKLDILNYGDFIGINPYFIKCNSKERIDIDYPQEFNIALYHYYNSDAIYGIENKEALKLNSLFNLDKSSDISNFPSKDVEKKEIKLIDVTIRDGGFSNDWNWELNDVEEKLKTASNTGIEYFEIGYLCDDVSNSGHFRNVSFDTINNIYNKINPKCKICVLFDSWRYDVNKLPQKIETKIDLVRVVTYIEIEKVLFAIEQCKNIKKKGYEVSLNIMCGSYLNNDILYNLKEVILSNINIFDYIYIADSYGSMEPDDVITIFSSLNNLKNIKKDLKIGFHIHNNGEIGMANFISSMKYIDIVDGSYFGLGRGYGNIKLENLIFFFKIKKNYDLNIEEFIKYLDNICDNYKKTKIKNSLLGFLNIHPYRITEEKVNLLDTYNNYIKLTNKEKYIYDKNSKITNKKYISNKDKDNSYTLKYNSSSIKNVNAELGTIEKDACGNFGNFETEEFRGSKIFDILIKEKFKTVLDIGAGKLEATNKFIKNKKIVDICDYEDSLYYQKNNIEKEKINKIYFGDFMNLNFDKNYDAIWCSHILEHILNPNLFLKKIFSLLKEDGILSIIVPPRKPIIVGGHVSIWNSGLLLYHLIHAGFDCSEAKILQYDYNIGVIVKKKSIKEFPKIHYDYGDLLLLKNFFPKNIIKDKDSFNGDILENNI